MPQPVTQTDAPSPVAAPAGACPQGEERRREPRRLAESIVQCSVTVGEDSAASNAVLVDVSGMGVSLVVARAVEPGDRLVVHVPIDGPGYPALDLPARVAHRARLAAGPSIVGAEFARPLDEAELAAVSARTGLGQAKP